MTERSRREKEKEREIRCLLLCSRYSVCVLEQSFQKQYRNNWEKMYEEINNINKESNKENKRK